MKRSRSTCSIPVAVLLAGAAAMAAPRAEAQTPDTDIHVAELERTVDGLRLGAHRNITARAGYDNQPHFTQDGAAILYTRIDEAGQADIWRHDLATGVSAPVTRTAPESEYSATPLPGGGFTVIRVERDSTQRLWRFDDDGGGARVVFDSIRPVGYHAWGDEHRAALFVLGQPATLRLADTRTGGARVLASNIGRALQKVPGRAAVSFLHMLPAPEGQPAPAGWRLRMLDIETGAITDIATPPWSAEGGAAEYHAWLPDGTLITAVGSTIQAWDAAAREWRVIADYAADGLTISRLAASPDGSGRIAFVAERRGR